MKIQEMFRLDGRKALVTGSSGGLGLVFAEGLAAAGAHVILNGRNAEKLKIATASLQSKGYSVSSSVFDVTDEKAVVKAIEELGNIDILVNNAGIQIRGPLEDFSLEDWNKVIDINLSGAFVTTKAIVKGMIGQGRGNIVNICSLQSELGRNTIAPYAASKGGIKMLTRAMAVEWAKHGIQVNGIGPGYFLTDMTKALAEKPEFDSWVKGRTPAGRWGDPRELLPALILLCSNASSFINGQVIYVDGGLSISV